MLAWPLLTSDVTNGPHADSHQLCAPIYGLPHRFLNVASGVASIRTLRDSALFSDCCADRSPFSRSHIGPEGTYNQVLKPHYVAEFHVWSGCTRAVTSFAGLKLEAMPE